MEITQTEQTENEPIDVLEDEFSSSKENSINRFFIRIIQWLFSPPGLPPVLIWLLALIIISDICGSLLLQNTSYWSDASITHTESTLGTPLNWGPLITILIYLGYVLVLGLLLPVLNKKIAFIIWVFLSSYHAFYFSVYFKCQLGIHFSFLNSQYCSQFQLAAIIFICGLFALGIATAYSMGILPLNQEKSENNPAQKSKWLLVVKVVSVIWLLTLVIMTATSAFPAKAKWQLLEPIHAPTPRSSAALAYDTQRLKAVLFGGTSEWTAETEWNNLGDTWEWNGSDWIEKFPVNSPSARRDALIVFDETRGVTVLFGGVFQKGRSDLEFRNDVWEWDGTEWTEKKPDLSPPARGSGIIYFDPVSQKVIIHGGYYINELGEAEFPEDMWSWDGETWEEIVMSRLSNASGEAYVYDPNQRAPMMVGTWETRLFKDNRWYQPTYINAINGRSSGAMAYAPDQQQVVLFGGSLDNTIFDDTWTFSNLEWKKVITKIQPSARSGHNLFYDPTRKSIILFGGIKYMTFLNDTWELILP